MEYATALYGGTHIIVDASGMNVDMNIKSVCRAAGSALFNHGHMHADEIGVGWDGERLG